MRSRPGNLVDASEANLIKYVLAQCRRLYDLFGFVVDPALGFPREGWDYRILCNVDRALLALDPALKPGDIDIIIVPTKTDRLYVEYAMAVEVKRLYLPLDKRWRDTNSSGIAQARGLLRDGFPFVGILHLVLAETSPRTEWQKVMTAWIVGDTRSPLLP